MRWHLPDLIGGPRDGQACADSMLPDSHSIHVLERLPLDEGRTAKPGELPLVGDVYEHLYVLNTAATGMGHTVTFYAHHGLDRREAVTKLLTHMLRRSGAIAL